MTDGKFSPELKDDGLDEPNPLASIQAATGQKRPQDSIGGPAAKKSHIDSEDSVQVKVLIPSIAVGALIGKGGETMRNLKTESQCRVQMSKNQEVYHGTNERICMVKGKIGHVMLVMEAISEKIREKVDPNSPGDAFDHKGVSRVKEMKLLMPNTSAGMVIGKAGASIKEIRDSTGCQIQVFPKAGTNEAKNSLERIITVAHDEIDALMRAVQQVLQKVAADPQHDKPVDNKDTDNFHQVFGAGNNAGYDFNRSYGASAWGGASRDSLGGYSNGNYKYNPLQGTGNQELLSFLDSLQMTLRTSGFNEASVAEVMQAMQVLAKYNIMGLGLGLGVAAMAQMRQGADGSGGDQSLGAGGAEVRGMGGMMGGGQQATPGQGYAQTAGLTSGYYANHQGTPGITANQAGPPAHYGYQQQSQQSYSQPPQQYSSQYGQQQQPGLARVYIQPH